MNFPPLPGPHSVGIQFGVVPHTPDISYLYLYPSLKTDLPQLSVQETHPLTTELNEERNRILGFGSENLKFLEQIRRAQSAKIHARVNAPFKNDEKDQKIPILIFIPAYAGIKDHYAGFVEQIASYGIAVLVMDSPHWQFQQQSYFYHRNKFETYIPTEKLNPQALREKRFEFIDAVLTHILSGSLGRSFAEIYLGGHSWGGNTALWAMSEFKKQLTGYFSLDGVFDVGQDQSEISIYPASDAKVLYVLAESAMHIPQFMIENHFKNLKNCTVALIPNSHHNSFSNFGHYIHAYPEFAVQFDDHLRSGVDVYSNTGRVFRDWTLGSS